MAHNLKNGVSKPCQCLACMEKRKKPFTPRRATKKLYALADLGNSHSASCGCFVCVRRAHIIAGKDIL